MRVLKRFIYHVRKHLIHNCLYIFSRFMWGVGISLKLKKVGKARKWRHHTKKPKEHEQVNNQATIELPSNSFQHFTETPITHPFELQNTSKLPQKKPQEKCPASANCSKEAQLKSHGATNARSWPFLLRRRTRRSKCVLW